MCKKALVLSLVFVVASVASAFAVEAGAIVEPQVVAKANLKTWDRENVAGGKGTLFGKYSLTRHDAPEGYAIKEIGWMTLQPGASIGMHKHENNEDAYIIISGEGMFSDSEGKETKVKAGDITIARKGQSHALANIGNEPLIFLDIIGQK